MRDIEKHNSQIAGILLKTDNHFPGSLLQEMVQKTSKVPTTVDYAAFGLISV